MESVNNLFSGIYHGVEARYTNSKKIPSRLYDTIERLVNTTIGVIATPVAAYTSNDYHIKLTDGTSKSVRLLPNIFRTFMLVVNPNFEKNRTLGFKALNLDCGSQGIVSSYVAKKIGLDKDTVTKIQHAYAIPLSVITGIFDAVIAVPAAALTILTAGSIPKLNSFTMTQLRFLGEINEISFHFYEILG